MKQNLYIHSGEISYVVGILFWNIGKRLIANQVAELCHESDCDILILAECEYKNNEIIDEINKLSLTSPFSKIETGISVVRFYTRLPTNKIETTLDAGRISIKHILPIIGAPLLVVAAHLRSKLRADIADQKILTTGVIAAIRLAEATVGHQNTIVIGDLNMHPFDEPMISADGFHAVSDKNIALKGKRSVDDVEYAFFYNPFWSRLGDESWGPSGSFYLNKGGAVNHYWSAFDQVLLRPALLPFYQNDRLRVITSIKGRPLLKGDGLDNSISDHLPIMVNLSTESAIS